MKMHIIKALGAAGSAGALGLLCLIGAGDAASASPSPVQPAGPATVSSLRMPGGFQPAAASFVSPTWGVVLGSAGHTAGHASRAQLAVTDDGGMYWYRMPVPALWLANGGSTQPQVSQVLFANRADGWLYDQYNSDHIWVTHDGGASWREITLPGDVQTMAAAGNAVYAVIGDHLYRSPLGWDAWLPVTTWTWSGPSPITGSILAVSGDAVWFGGGSHLWTTANGLQWTGYQLPSEGSYYGTPYALAGIAAASPRDVTFLYAAPTGMYHTGMKVTVSFNGGRSEWQTLTAPPAVGDVAAFAATPGRFGVITVAVVTPGLDNLYRSANLGQSWTTFGVPGTGGGAALSSLEFMSPAIGCFVTGNPAYGIPSQLLWTTNAGRTWYPVRF